MHHSQITFGAYAAVTGGFVEFRASALRALRRRNFKQPTSGIMHARGTNGTQAKREGTIVAVARLPPTVRPRSSFAY